MKEKKNVRNIIATLLLLLFAAHYVNTNFFYHSHTINGITIVHSHIHGKAHTSNGNHTTGELRLISSLSLLQALAAVVLFSSTVFLAFSRLIRNFSCSRKPLTEHTGMFLSRAPPAFV